jgi:hypothetical protein
MADPGTVTLLSAATSIITTAITSWFQYLAQRKKPNRKRAEKYRDQARLASTVAIGLAVTALIAAVGMTYWLWSVQKTILVPQLGPPTNTGANKWIAADTDGFVVATILYPGPDSNKPTAVYGRGHVAGYVALDPTKINGYDDLVTRCTANASRYESSVEYCNIVFPVPGGHYYKVETHLYGVGGQAIVKFVPLAIRARPAESH